jgi:hypothetical protein
MDFGQLDELLFPPVTGLLLAAKIFFILFCLGVFSFMVYVWWTTIYMRRIWIWDLKEFLTYRSYLTRVIDKDWANIKRRLLQKKESEYKLAIIEADLLVNDVLTRANFEGRVLSEKLEKRAASFSDIAAMKFADQLYRDIVNDPSYNLDYENAKAAILAFEQGLRDVRAFQDK